MAAELGQTSDPTALVPGIPERIFDNARVLQRRSEDARATGQALHRIDTGAWTGQAASRFHEAHQTEVPRWRQAGDSLATASRALRDYAETLVWAQRQATEAIDLFNRAQAATEQARTHHEQAAAEADKQPPPGAGSPVPFQDPGEEQRQAARDLLQRARQQLADVGDRTADTLASESVRAPQDSQKQSDLNFYGGILDSAQGAGESLLGIVTDPAGTVSAMAHNITHPVETLKSAVAWDDWANGRGDRALGKLTGDFLIGAATLGTGKVAKSLLSRHHAPDGPDSPPRGNPPGAPDDWSSRTADNGKGTVYQKPGAHGNADQLRVMDATQRYPNGYVRFYNEHGQPVDLNGRPGPKSNTHIPRRDDGSYPTPEGW